MPLFSRILNRKKTLSLEGMTDWHCHILPGVDDGVRTMDESISILKSYEEAGIAEVWLTPHIMEDVPNTTDFLRQRFVELQDRYHGSVKLYLAAENMLDNLFEERLQKNDLLPLGKDGKHLLVETSYFNPPMGLTNILLRIKAKGYYPLLAHPERYNYMDSFSYYLRLREMGVKFQINLMSLYGHYGSNVRDKALRFILEGYCDYFGTDLHRCEHLDIIQTMKLNTKIINQIYKIKSVCI